MAEYDAKGLQDKNDNDLNFTPTHYFDGNTKKNIAEEIGKKQDTLTAGSGIKIDANNMISAQAGKLHKISLATDSVVGSTSPHGYWIVDLEKPNANAPGGYDRLTVDAATSILEAGEIFLLPRYQYADNQENYFQQLVKYDSQTNKVSKIFLLWSLYSENPDKFSLIVICSYNGYMVVDITDNVSRQFELAQISYVDTSIDTRQVKQEIVTGTVSQYNELALLASNEGQIVTTNTEVTGVTGVSNFKHIVIQFPIGTNNSRISLAALKAHVWKFEPDSPFIDGDDVVFTSGRIAQLEVINNCVIIKEFAMHEFVV